MGFIKTSNRQIKNAGGPNAVPGIKQETLKNLGLK